MVMVMVTVMFFLPGNRHEASPLKACPASRPAARPCHREGSSLPLPGRASTLGQSYEAGSHNHDILHVIVSVVFRQQKESSEVCMKRCGAPTRAPYSQKRYRVYGALVCFFDAGYVCV